MIDLIGSIREVEAEETLRNALRPDVWRIVGITRLADVTRLDFVGVPVYVAIRPNAKCLSTSQGKGITPTLAKVSALMEAIEIWHAEELPKAAFYGPYYQYSADYNVRNFAALLTSSDLYAPDFVSIPMSWLAGRDIATETTCYIPWSLCSVDYTRMPPEASFLPGSTNGLASGNSLSEAICHGLFEVVERESEADFTGPPLQRIVDVSSIPLGYLHQLIEACTRARISVEVFDITGPIGIPTYRAIISDQENFARNPGTFMGTGTHLSPEIALSRALTEAIQSRLTVITGTRDDLSPYFYINATRRSRARPVPESSHRSIPFQHRSTPLPATFSGWIAEVLAKLEAAGFGRASYVDLTNPQLGIPVVKVLVEGCRFNPFIHVNRPRRRVC